jgi:predicted dehydrogenase
MVAPIADKTDLLIADALAPRKHVLRATVIGTGKISEEHLRFLGADPRAKLVGVCDLSPALAQYAASRFKAERAFSSSAEMLRETQPDVVHVLTPPHTHMMLVTEALNAGAHVIVEKPVAPTNAEFRQLHEMARSKKLRIVEDHNYRFNEPILEIERLMRAGELGDVKEVDVRLALPIRKAGGRYADPSMPHPSHNLPAGVIHEFITHLCYLLLRFMPADTLANGREPRVCAAWSKHGSEPLFKYDDLDCLIISDGVHGRIRFTSHTAPDSFNVCVRGTRGWAETNIFQPYVRVVKPRKGGQQLSPLVNQWVNGVQLARSSIRGFWDKLMQKTTYEGLATFLDRTYAALVDGKEPPVTFADMDRASRLVDALLDERNRA